MKIKKAKYNGLEVEIDQDGISAIYYMDGETKIMEYMDGGGLVQINGQDYQVFTAINQVAETGILLAI
tara:strand:- start:676 stop:879 length:204 start_codon:yes stop_codon:yes gene_type:complete